MSGIDVKFVTDGHNNCVLKVAGIINRDLPFTKVFLFTDLTPAPRALKLDSTVYAIQDKLTCIFWWITASGYELMAPLEGKGRLDWEAVQGLHSPREAVTGLAISTMHCDELKHFVVTLDFTKQ
jgi:hypothetical protein